MYWNLTRPFSPAAKVSWKVEQKGQKGNGSWKWYSTSWHTEVRAHMESFAPHLTLGFPSFLQEAVIAYLLPPLPTFEEAAMASSPFPSLMNYVIKTGGLEPGLEMWH